jgi:MFS family permease
MDPVLMGHLMNFNTWGYINSYGIFEAYYISNLGVSASAVAWIGSIQIFLLCFVGAFSGRALDAGYYRHVMIGGCFLQVFGIFMTSLSSKYWQLFLAQGLCQGLGNGLLFSPTLALVSTYFVKKRSLAVAIVAGGSGTGGIVFVLLAQHLLPSLGFPWTLRIMGFVALCNAVVIVLLSRPRLPPRKAGPLLEFSAFKEIPFLLFVIGMFLTLWPVYFDFDYVSPFILSLPWQHI